MRIQQHPILEFKKEKKVTFFFEGRPVEGFEGEPIAAALHAAGIKVLRHSVKLDRPRGFFCAIGKCSSCLMEVDGAPNVFSCVTPIKDGMQVRRQEGRGKLKTG
ncbi:MAG TPA: pyridine nucleotide-disulfide oxidoreductase [candidate division Zixibacteria bacterium]|nr:pyridine nucleotide-disulfide oxidoreductase [candidate division Zixibacteria bacterium]